MSEPTSEGAAFEGFDRADLLAHIAMLNARVADQNALIDRLATPAGEAGDAVAADGDPAERQSTYLLAFDEEQQAAEIEAMTPWVESLLRTTYGREVSTNRPWCTQWAEHIEAVVLLHALWLAFQQHTDAESGGLAGNFVWHRDFLYPALANLRAPDGPFGACMTHPDRPTHRLLPPPPPAAVPDVVARVSRHFADLSAAA